MKKTTLKSFWIVNLCVILGAAAAFCLVNALPTIRAQEVATCHHCLETRLIVEQSAVHCTELPERIEYFRDQKFMRFQIEVREDEITLEPVCEIVAVK